MAKKITPRESCVFCDKHPCECAVVSREKKLRKDAKADKEVTTSGQVL